MKNHQLYKNKSCLNPTLFCPHNRLRMSGKICACLPAVLSLFLFICPLWSMGAAIEDCVFIEDCQPIFWMMKNMKNIPNRTIEQVSETLQ